ncbi:MAG: putative TauE-like permease [Candidatus Saganbacteria bacterium]|uniref:Probable membrane transporter protein n=1 Tax=Candidatus Saganbacteria bacterium TaxID=2575572 RepID=A0A833L269_UNCSA|nr:MAG: putative TauE-like permease [Candidatus Saganbacteria bacterium]
MIEILGLILIGLAGGTLSGLLGVGGATILIPCLLIMYKMTQHMAQGTSIAALLLPVGILAALKYYQAGNINIKFSLYLALGFLVGGLIGATLAQPMPDLLLKRMFGIYLLIIAIQIIFFS